VFRLTSVYCEVSAFNHHFLFPVFSFFGFGFSHLPDHVIPRDEDCFEEGGICKGLRASEVHKEIGFPSILFRLERWATLDSGQLFFQLVDIGYLQIIKNRLRRLLWVSVEILIPQ
jgi:hypothetical protein